MDGPKLAIGFGVIAQHELRAERTSWVLCVWRWRWPVLVTRGVGGTGIGWFYGVGWIGL